MRRIREVLRQRWECGLSERTVATSCLLARSTVGKYIKRAGEVGLSRPLPEGLTDEELERCLFPDALSEVSGPRFVPDWAELRRQLAQMGLMLRLVREEYKEAHPDGFQYTRFCIRYRPGLRPWICPCARSTRRARDCSWTIADRPRARHRAQDR
jgi:transposase